MSRTTRARLSGSVLPAVAAIAAVFLLGTPAVAAPKQPKCDKQKADTYAELLECVTVEGVREHQAAFQAIATANGGNRAADTPGYTGSVEYVVDTLEAAGWSVSLDEFDYPVALPIQQHTPVATTHPTSGATGSAMKTVTATPVTPVDINLVPPRANSSGCDGAYTEAAVGAPLTPDPGGVDDFAGFTPGNIALIQRGTCSFALKVANAQAAGASAVILFNQGNTPARSGVLGANASPPPGSNVTITIPVVGTSFAAGEALAQPGTTATVAVENHPQVNVLGELEGKNKDNVVMAGAHLDSVEEGPGIQDNGSGSAALLELAERLGRLKPQNTLRFAWWGAEEAGLVGSTAYVNELSEAERDRIALYLNFDMVGSPNYIFMVYDADQSTYEAPVEVPAGSTAIEDLFESFYTWKDEPYDDSAFDGRSDYQAFIEAGIPSGGLFTGAEDEKTAEQAAIWGGTAGAWLDPCYHQACDTFANVSMHALDVNADAIAFAVLTYAYSTESVNGVKGKKIPGKKLDVPAPAGEQGTFR